MSTNLEVFWADILSEDPTRIAGACKNLPEDERNSLVAHLRRMAEESGWSEEQRRRAQSALDFLQGRD